MMLTLGIETSCDETGVSLTESGRVLSNVVSSSVHLHKRYGGVVPEIASRYHLEYILEAMEEALAKASKKLSDVKLVAVTNGPGLVGALLTGISMAKAVSYAKRLPLIGVNHIHAHLYSAFLNQTGKPRFPFIGLVVSGGHTVLFLCKDVDKQKMLGQTQDDAVGEAYDKVSKLLGLGYPGGPAIEKAAKLATDRKSIRFPISFMGKDSLDFSFSGVKTAVLYYINGAKARGSGKLDRTVISNVAYAFQESVLDAVVEKTVAACRASGLERVVVGGGVTANSRLREKFAQASSVYGLDVYFPEFRYCLDNAAMVGSLGEQLYRRGHRSDLRLNAEPNLGV